MIKKDMELIEKIPFPEVDIDTLKGVLQDYSKPYEKINSWVEQGVLTRMTRGWYLLGKEFRKRPWSREYVANVIYRSSCISLDYALSFYSLIPERVNTITSITPRKSRVIETPLGRFSYRKVPQRIYRAGMDLQVREGSPSFFIATPEKALADKVNQFFTSEEIKNTDLQELLIYNLRIEPEMLMTLDQDLMDSISHIYQSRRVTALADFIRKLRREGETDNE